MAGLSASSSSSSNDQNNELRIAMSSKQRNLAISLAISVDVIDQSLKHTSIR
jgi:hypothetical protein